MGDLARWLGEQLDEDERLARAADPELNNLTGCIEIEYPEIKADELHALRHSPTRVLREIDAKRQLLARYEELRAASKERGLIGDVTEEYQDFLLRVIAMPYADRPGYREEWAP